MIKKQQFETSFLMGLLIIYTDTFQMNLTCLSKPFLFYLRRNREKRKLSFNPPPLSTRSRKV